MDKIRYPNPYSRAIFEFWQSGDRWYWHRKVNGRLTDDGNYASRSSCRRALKQRVERENHG